jgi:hypothetical protein
VECVAAFYQRNRRGIQRVEPVGWRLISSAPEASPDANKLSFKDFYFAIEMRIFWQLAAGMGERKVHDEVGSGRENKQSKIILGYALMIIGVGGAYLAIRWYGEGLNSLSAVQTMKSAGGSASSADMMLHVLLALMVVIVMARTLGALFRKIHQPPVIGEIIAGIVLGPSVLGRIEPGSPHMCCPHRSRPFSI